MHYTKQAGNTLRCNDCDWLLRALPNHTYKMAHFVLSHIQEGITVDGTVIDIAADTESTVNGSPPYLYMCRGLHCMGIKCAMVHEMTEKVVVALDP